MWKHDFGQGDEMFEVVIVQSQSTIRIAQKLFLPLLLMTVEMTSMLTTISRKNCPNGCRELGITELRTDIQSVLLSMVETSLKLPEVKHPMEQSLMTVVL